MPSWGILSFRLFPLDGSTVQPSVNVKMGNRSLWPSRRVVRVACFCLSAECMKSSVSGLLECRALVNLIKHLNMEILF